VLSILVEADRRFRRAYCLIALMMEAVRISETSVCFNEATQGYMQKAAILKERM
jgi:hypothetical protein